MADDYGNSMTTAGTLVAGTDVAGSAGERNDEDWFGIQLQAGTTYWFEALGLGNGGGTLASPALLMYDGEGAYIRGVVIGGANHEPLLSFTPLVSGIHYVGVRGDRNGGTYTLRATIAPNPDDFRDDSATEATLAVGGQVTGNVEVITDQDWFRAELAAGATYVFELRGVDGGGGTAGGGDGDLLLRLASSAPLPVSATRGGTGGDPLLTYTAIESGTHYVQVQNQVRDGGTGTYTLSAIEVPTQVNFIGGTSDNDVLNVTPASDLIAGGAGLDIVTYPGLIADYVVSRDRFSHIITVTGSGSDALHGIERLHFDGVGRAFDLDGNAGMVARTLGAVFGAASVQNRDYMAIGLALVDGGMDFEQLVEYALDRALGEEASSAEIVNLLYTNVMRSAPPQPALDYYTGLLDEGQVSPGWLGVYAAQTIYNEYNTLGSRPAEYPLFFTIG